MKIVMHTNRSTVWAAVTSGLLVMLLAVGCRHEPPVGPEIVDPTGNGGGDPGVQNCATNIIWFQQQVLPILASSCTNPGAGMNCHHTPNDNNDDIQIISYETLMASDIIDMDDPMDSDLWEVINDNDPDDRMPRPPLPPLTPEQIAIIGQWLQQGAQNTSCENAGCDTVNVTYSGTIQPLVEQRCRTCHSGSSPSAGLDLTQYNDLFTVAMDGRLEGAIKRWPDPYIPMPPSIALPDCQVEQFMQWIEDGAPQN